MRIQEANQDIETINQTESLNALAIEEAEKRHEELAALLETKKKELDDVLSDTQAEQKELESRTRATLKRLLTNATFAPTSGCVHAFVMAERSSHCFAGQLQAIPCRHSDKWRFANGTEL